MFLHQGASGQGVVAASAADHGSYIISPLVHHIPSGIPVIQALTHQENRSLPVAGAPFWTDRRWLCPDPNCDYVTHCESKLKMHFRRHTGEKPFVCLYCSFRSAQKGNLNVHIRKYHSSSISPSLSLKQDSPISDYQY